MKVGEQTGKLDEVLFQLADHYERLQTLLRNFMLGIAWPMFEFAVAILVIAFVIWAPTALSGQEIDALGIGLTGGDGAVCYLVIVAVLGALAAACIYALVRGWFGPGPLAVARRLPLVGRCLECLALARCSWVLALAHESGMSARKTARLALAASHHPLYRGKAQQIDAVLADSRPFHEAFHEAMVFPNDFLDALHTAELSGTITETMTRKTQDYEKESSSLLTKISVIAGALVFLMVMVFMVIMIFTLFFKVYLNPINDILNSPLG
jgi:type IV pilus assembly protein PilC